MNFQNFYKPGQFTYSFEIYPPKTKKGIASLFNELKQVADLKPSFISVTYGAMGTTRDVTGDLAIRIQRELGLTAAFHFTCVGTDREAIKEYVQHLEDEGLHLVVALRGDAPQGTTKFEESANGFKYANELVAYLKEINNFSIAVAGYPEGHIEAPSKEVDLINLKRKVDAGADIVITQLFFNNEDYFDFVDRARKIGITIPIVPGIMPILNVGQIEKIAGMCGAKIPKSLSDKLHANMDDPLAAREVGVEYAIKQCRELLDQGVPGVHFYILNKSYSVRKIIKALRVA